MFKFDHHSHLHRSYKDIFKTIMNRFFKSAVILSLIITSSPSFAGNLVSWGDDWGSSLRSLSGENLEPTGRLVEMGRLQRQIRLEYIRRRPYSLSHAQGSVDWHETSHRLQLSWPIFRSKHSFAVMADLWEETAGGAAASFNYQSKLSLKDDYSTSELGLAHHWQALKLRWGVGLRWTHYGVDSYFDPVWELEWGEDAAARFIIHLERHTQINPWSWKLEADSLAGNWAAQWETASFAVMFGDPFGIQMRMNFTDNYLKGVDNPSGRPCKLTPLGQKQTVSAYLERSPLTGLRWKIGGAHSNQQAEATLTSAGKTVVRAAQFDATEDCWGGALGGNWGRRWNWLTASHYYQLRGQIGGLILSQPLPEAFKTVISEDRFYFGDAVVTGSDLSVSLATRGSWFLGQIEAGYGGFNIDQNLEDFDPTAEDARYTKTGLEGVGLAWVTLQGGVNWSRLDIDVSFSQMFPVWEMYHEGYKPLTERRLRGGWLAKLGLSYRLN
ncbi:MAG: hypothetical protein V2A61_01930, partial [Calditrichota bacterium]